MTMTWRSFGRWLAVLMLLGGCSCCCGNWGPVGFAPDLADADIVGTWVSEEGARLVLRADHTFSTHSLGDCADADGDHAPGADGEGLWTLDEPELLDPYQQLNLAYHPYGESLQSWGAQDDEIVYVFGDTDSGGVCYFTRD
ncbi:hypothetical protein [Catellatospora sichuanensis]|uniref:hypothetical protein n=1 Tax=Catellatospora sichuanensis TaxID=1969805 RepID=UPI001182E830|nr:hypothetical protein [Catellatospora sichuanensis]